MTLLGIFFIPLVLGCFFWRPFYLLPLVVVSSVFEAGSVFNGQLGDFEFGLSPFYLTEIFIALRLLMLVLKRAKLGDLLPEQENKLRPVAWLLVAFWGWCFWSA